jgi:hypothetical protein
MIKNQNKIYFEILNSKVKIKSPKIVFDEILVF